MQVGKVNSELQKHFQDGATMAEEWKKKAKVEALVFLPHTIKINILKRPFKQNGLFICFTK